MPERQYRALTKRIVDRLAVNGKDAVFWDSELPGSAFVSIRRGARST